MARGSSPKSPGLRVHMIVLVYSIVSLSVQLYGCVVPLPYMIYIVLLWHDIACFVLKVPLNNSKPNLSSQSPCLALATHHLLHFYIAVIRPVLEYCAPVWHYALAKAQTQELESIQKCAIHIIFHFTRGMPYPITPTC